MLITPANKLAKGHDNFITPLLAISVLIALASFPIAINYSQITDYSGYIGVFSYMQFALLALCMLLCWWYTQSHPHKQSLSTYKNLLIVAIVIRVLLIPVDHYTSNDVDRYLFDGYIASSGLDPYTVSHNDSQLSDVIGSWAPPKEHLKYVTLYPPLAVSLYAIAASFGVFKAMMVWNIMIALASILTVVVSLFTLKKVGKLQHFPLVALSPILIFEGGIGVHIDTFATLFVSLALYFFVSTRYVKLGIAIGLGTLVKLFPLVLFGPLFLYLRGWKAKMSLSLGLITCIGFGYASAFAFGWTPIGSLSVFFEKFRFGSPIFSLLESHLDARSLLYTTFGLILLGYAILALYSAKAGKQQNTQKLYLALQLSLGLPLFFGPVVYPWYLMVFIPLLALYPSGWLLVWTLVMPFTYEVLGSWVCCQQWQPQNWPLILISAGFSISLLLSIFYNKLTPNLALLRRPLVRTETQ